MMFESGRKAFIICEVGSNWTSLEDCLHSIRCAKVCGADAVKFQLYDWASLYGIEPNDLLLSDSILGGEFAILKTNNLLGNYDGNKCDDQNTKKQIIDTSMQRKRLTHNDRLVLELRQKHAKMLPYFLLIEWLPQLKAQADAVGIEFMCSAFSTEFSDEVNKYVNIHKVASAEMTHVRILERIAGYGKPCLLSTGASGESDIRQALRVLGGTETILLYCVANYPARYVDFVQMKNLGVTFDKPFGFSDHTTDVAVIPKQASIEGAVVIEKHVTFIDAVTPDSSHSLNQREFELMVKSIRFPDQSPGLYNQEHDMYLKHNRRIKAIKDIKAGDKLIENDNFGIYRSLIDDAHAYSPFLINELQERVAKKDINAGQGIGPGDL